MTKAPGVAHRDCSFPLPALLRRVYPRFDTPTGRAIQGALRKFEVMKLYITSRSPYARIGRIVVIGKRLESWADIVLAQTRLADSPYYSLNPSGRVRYLVRRNTVSKHAVLPVRSGCIGGVLNRPPPRVDCG